MPKPPFFSIIIPCYNQSDWLKQCVSAITQQSFSDWEIIIVNDGSTDQTAQVADHFALNDERIQVIHQHNQGLSAARNTGINHAKGTWLQFHDSDDYLLNHCLKRVFSLIESKPDIQFVQVGHDLVDEKNELIQHNELKADNGSFWPFVKKGNPGPPLSFFTHRNLINRVGYFDTSLNSVEDWDFWIRVGKLGITRFVIKSCLVAYRYTPQSMSRNPWRMYENNVSVIERIGMKDQRISDGIDNQEDKLYDLRQFIKIRLIQSLGLCIMQGNVEDALDRFRKEGRHYHLEFTPADFRQMNSYMTFKNLVRKSEVTEVLQTYPKLFSAFFSKTYFTPAFQEAAILHVFIAHQKKQNHFNFGILGKLKNLRLDNKRRDCSRCIEKGY